MDSHAEELEQLKAAWQTATPGVDKQLALVRYKAGLELAGLPFDQIEDEYVEAAVDALK